MRVTALLLLPLAACGVVDELDPPGTEPGESVAEVLDLGVVQIATPDGELFTGTHEFELPEGTVGATVVVELPGTPDELVSITELSRGGSPVTPLRVDPVEALCALPYPAAPEIEVRPGKHRITVVSNTSYDRARVTGVAKIGGSPEAGVLDVHLHIVGVEGLNAAKAAADARIIPMRNELRRLLALAGIELGQMRYFDVDDPALFEIEGPSSAPGTRLARLFARSEDTPGRAVNVFLVRRLFQADEMPLLGISGGVPGPGEIAGTIHSGVAVNAEDLEDRGPQQRGRGPLLVGQIMAHEILHYLGLHHTSERELLSCGGEGEHDVIADTPACGPDQDRDEDCQLSTSECASHGADNLMFWAGVDYDRLPSGADARVTGGQGRVVRRNPLVR